MSMLLWVAAFAVAQPSPELHQDFESGTERALQGDLEGAAGLYRSIIERGGVHPDVYFNLGNVYAELGRPVDAVIAYERALRLNPTDADAKTNLQIVRAELVSKNEAQIEAESVTLVDALEPALSPLPVIPIAYGVVGLELILFLALWFFRKAERSTTRRTWVVVSVLAGLGALGAGVITTGHWAIHHDSRAVVRKTGPLRQGPDARFKPAGDVSAGARVRVLDEDRGWIQIQPADGTTGWISTDEVVRL